MRKFGNTAHKISIVLKAFRDGETLSGGEIARRIKRMGYRVNEGSLKMFIYYNMLYKYLQKEPINGVNHYSIIG